LNQAKKKLMLAGVVYSWSYFFRWWNSVLFY
jgi:hypothetical protein